MHLKNVIQVVQGGFRSDDPKRWILAIKQNSYPTKIKALRLMPPTQTVLSFDHNFDHRRPFSILVKANIYKSTIAVLIMMVPRPNSSF